MTEEEKKAIKIIRNQISDFNHTKEYANEFQVRFYDAIETVLNLVKKQQEDIDRLLKDNRELGNRINELTDELHKIYPPAKAVE